MPVKHIDISEDTAPPRPFRTEEIPPLSAGDRRWMMIAAVMAFPLSTARVWAAHRRDRGA